MLRRKYDHKKGLMCLLYDNKPNNAGNGNDLGLFVNVCT